VPRPPEYNRSLERRAAGQVTDDLGNQDRRIGRQFEAPAGPFPHALQGGQMFGALFGAKQGIVPTGAGGRGNQFDNMVS